MVVIVALEPLLLVFPWPCCSTRAGGALGRQTGGSATCRAPWGFWGVLFSSHGKGKMHPWSESFQQQRHGSNGCCVVVPHIWVQLPAATPHLGIAVHNAEVTPKTADAAYASNIRMVNSWQMLVGELFPLPGARRPRACPGSRSQAKRSGDLRCCTFI